MDEEKRPITKEQLADLLDEARSACVVKASDNTYMQYCSISEKICRHGSRKCSICGEPWDWLKKQNKEVK